MSKVRYSSTLLSVGKTTCLLSQRHPAYRQHELYTGIQAELGNLSARCEEKRSSGRTRKSESIDAFHGGRAPRSSEDGYRNVARAKGLHYLALCINRNCLKSNLQEV
jgi:hypothetical protein